MQVVGQIQHLRTGILLQVGLDLGDAGLIVLGIGLRLFNLGNSDEIGKSCEREIFHETKVPKVEEYCMYLSLLELHE